MPTTLTMTDKNIVDRSRIHKNAAVVKAVRATREQLQHGRDGLHGFDNEMLRLHINTVLQGAAAPPVLVILTAVGGLWFDDALWLLAWSLLALIVYAGLILVARRASREHSSDEGFGRWHKRFLAVYGVVGVTWAIFAYQQCTTCQGDTFIFYKSAALLIALAATAMATFALRNALYYAAAPAVIALAVRAGLTRDPADISVLAMISAAALFFVFMSNRLYTTNLNMLFINNAKILNFSNLWPQKKRVFRGFRNNKVVGICVFVEVYFLTKEVIKLGDAIILVYRDNAPWLGKTYKLAIS